MALRRPILPRLRLNRQLSTVRSPPNDAQPNSKPGRGRRSAESMKRSSRAYQPEFSEFLPPREHTELGDLLSAVQRQDESRICEAFVRWTSVLADQSSPLHDAAVREAQELPGPTFSEIVRSLDPILTQHHDVAAGIHLSQAQTQFTSIGKLVNSFGVRERHRSILTGMQALLAVRSTSHYGLTPADYEVFIRCAGAAVDRHAAKTFWAAMATNKLQDARTAKTWNEFIKARFMTEPLYYQHDRARVAVLARDLYSNREPVPMAALKHMEQMRLSMNALKREPWNRREDELEEDIRRLLRRRGDYRGYKGHWIRALYYGHEVDENLLCTSMIAFARSSSLHSIKTMILQSYYGITIEDDPQQPGNIQVSGGLDFHANSPLKPTTRLLHAVVEALGSMSHIPLAMKLVDFLSRRYELPIEHETWSNILNWTYLCASKPFQSMRRIHGDYAATTIRAADVRQVWEVMTDEPYNVTPSFDDYDVYIKTLLIQRSFGRAISLIREEILPYYATLEAAYQTALTDEILQNDIAPSPRATHRRLAAQTLKDTTHHRISTWFTLFLKSTSSTKSSRSGSVTHTLIPNLITEFGDFFHPRLRYRTAQGEVSIDRSGASDVTERFDWERRWRTTLPAKVAGIHVRDAEGSDDAAFEWPRVKQMRVLEWQRAPKNRIKKLGVAPKEGKGREYWDKLEDEMML